MTPLLDEATVAEYRSTVNAGGHAGVNLPPVTSRARPVSGLPPPPRCATTWRCGRALLGVDVGTTGVKAVPFERSGAAVTASAREYPLVADRPGWAEQDPRLIVAAALATMADVVGAAAEPTRQRHLSPSTGLCDCAIRGPGQKQRNLSKATFGFAPSASGPVK